MNSAGDNRINQTPTLAALHTLLLREHNRVADVLAGLNPLWSDEKLFQEARRVVVAEIQHITYQEWLPLNFGNCAFVMLLVIRLHCLYVCPTIACDFLQPPSLAWQIGGQTRTMRALPDLNLPHYLGIRKSFPLNWVDSLSTSCWKPPGADTNAPEVPLCVQPPLGSPLRLSDP